MRDQLRNNRLILLVLGVLLLVTLLLAVVYSSVFKENPSNIDTSTPSAPSNTAGRVFVKDLHKLEGSISQETQRYIESMLYSSVSQAKRDLYTGTIRSGSYSNILSGEIKIIGLTIDVEPADMTYSVSIRESQGTRSISVICAPKEMQINQSIKCTEMAWM